MLGLPAGFARNFNMWGGVGWGVSTLVFMCTHGTLLVCWCVHMVRCWCGTLLVCWCVHGVCVHMVRCWCVDVYTWYALGWGVSTGGVHVYTWYAAGVLMCTHGTWGGVGCVNVGRWCSCVHMVRCWCVDVYTWYVGWGGVCQRWCSCVHMVRCWCADVYTWYAAGVLMCTHGALLVCSCVHMVRCWCVDVYTWYVGWGGVCQRWCSCVHMVHCWCVDVYTWYVGWGGVCQRWCSCVYMVRCWCVDVYTWYAAGVFMCTHGTLLVCWCVHMVRCWCVHVYTWYAAGVFMCAHGTLLVCHVQTYHAIAVSCLIVHRFLILIGFNVFLLAMCLLSVWLFLFTSGVCDIYIYMYVYFMSVYICMQIVSNGNAVNYRWLLIFPPDLAKKTQVWTLSKHSMINCIWKKDMKSTCEQPHFIWKKHSKINTMTTRTTNGCGYSSHVVTVDLVPSRANPPGGANMLQSLFHKTIQETPLVDGNMWLPPRLPALSLRNAQLVFSRRQLNMGHPSRLGLGTSCDQLKDGAHFWSSTSEVVDFGPLNDNYTLSFLRAHDNHITTIWMLRTGGKLHQMGLILFADLWEFAEILGEFPLPCWLPHGLTKWIGT